jgi:hypothetical protein
MSKKITLKAWAEARFDPPPSAKTLQRWARDCRIFPLPVKVGRDWRVDADARYIANDDPILGDVVGTKAA